MRLPLKSLHYFSGLTLAVFILLHLSNHLAALGGVPGHLSLMTDLRKVYRQPLVEGALLLAVVVQILSGLRLWWVGRRNSKPDWAPRLQILSGLYLAFFLTVHTTAVLTGRAWFGLDTNLFFAAAGINTFPFNLFFIPYYFLAVAAVFVHLASLHYLKGSLKWGSENAKKQAFAMVMAGVAVGLLILFAFTNRFQGLPIPAQYLKTLGR